MEKPFTKALLLVLALSGAAAAAAELGFETSKPQPLALTGSVHLHNTGTAPTGEIEIVMYLPRNLAGQKVFNLDFLPAPAGIEEDRWLQKLARWKVSLQPGGHFFAMWVARAAAADVRFDLDRLRKAALPVPLPVRSLYVWESGDVENRQPSIERALGLAAYVRRTVSQDISGLPFPQAIPRHETPLVLANAMTAICHANDLPCRTVAAYVAGTSEFSIDTAGTAWNEIYFPQSGWVPMLVADAQEFGRRRAERIAVRTSGHETGGHPQFWGYVSGAGDDVRVVHRGYFSRARNARSESETIVLFQSLAQQVDSSQAATRLAGQTGSLAIGLLEPYLYRGDARLAETAAALIGSSRQKHAVVILVDAMGQTPEIDKSLAAQAEALTGQAFGARRDEWLAWIRKELLPAR